MGNNIIRLTTESELQSIQKETMINKSTKITKVSDNSVLSGIAAANAKVAKKAIKDIALAVSHLFPDSASGVTLDQVANNHGIASRLGAGQSSTYIRIIADNGTIYTQGTHTFNGANGVTFDLDDASVTVGTKGYIYAKVRSQLTGAITNVDPYTVNIVNPEPSGHIGVINEFAASNGRDSESDELFRRRIKEGQVQLSQKTLAMLEQAFISINSDVLRVIFEGIDQSGKVILSIVTQNGIDLTVNELAILLDQGKEYFALTEMLPIGNPPEATAIILKNIEYQTIDLDFRWSLFDNGLLDQTVIDIQVQFAKYVDFRFWDSSKDQVDWDTLIAIIKNTDNVKYVPDNFFTPNSDIIVDRNKLPRFRGFIARDLDGNIQVNQSGTIDPTFYPNDVNGSLEASVL